MKNIRIEPNFIGIALILASVLMGIGSINMDNSLPLLKEIALEAYPHLKNYVFDGVGQIESEVSLYELVNYESSSWMVKNEVARINSNILQFAFKYIFKDAKSCNGGIFFAYTMTWNGEWSGIFVSIDGYSSIMHEYESIDLGDNVYYVNNVPYGYE